MGEKIIAVIAIPVAAVAVYRGLPGQGSGLQPRKRSR